MPKKRVIFLLHFSPPDQTLLCSHEYDLVVTLFSFVTFRQLTFIPSFSITICNNCFDWSHISTSLRILASSGLPSASLYTSDSSLPKIHSIWSRIRCLPSSSCH